MVNDAWYAESGPEEDVVLSTRVTLARNLANFPFPAHVRPEEAARVRALVFDSVAQSTHAADFQAVSVNSLDTLGAQILSEREILQGKAVPGSGIVMRGDGKICCTVNDGDHVHITAFTSGLACTDAFTSCASLDSELQNTLQFAASYDFGFLTSSLSDCGSGMKISVRMHLPSLSFSGQIGANIESLAKEGLELSASYGAGLSVGTSLGCYYQLTARYAESGSELDQIALMTAAIEKLASQERKMRTQVQHEHATEIKNCVYRAFSQAKCSLLLSLRDSIEMLGSLKWGKDVGLVTEIDYRTLHALLYRVQEGHLHFFLKNGKFNFSSDIANNPALQIERLRALIIQECFEHVICGGND